MLFRRIQGLAGAALAAVFLLTAAPAVGAAETGTVTVHRGATAAKLSFPTTGPVQVQRGPAIETLAYKPRAAMAPKVLAGERLWFVDGGSGRLTACTLRKTTQVGGKRIRCYSRNLTPPLWFWVD